MAFRNAYESAEHSRQILDLIFGYDSFLDSLSVVADFGCGAGLGEMVLFGCDGVLFFLVAESELQGVVAV